MGNLNSRIIIAWAIFVFGFAITLAFLFKDYELAVSGMLLFIILTAFIPGWRSTLIAGVVSMVVMTGLVIYFKNEQNDIIRALLSQVYSLFVVVFSVIVIFYLKRMQQNFAYEKTHMASLFENATEGILLTDKTGSIILINPAAERMFGYSSNELFGEKIEKLIPQRFHDKHVGLREGFYKRPANRSMGTGRDLYARRKDDSEFPVEISLSHYMQKSEAFVIGFIVDITARKEIEKNLLRQKMELEKISNDIRKLNADLEGKVEERTIILKEALQKLEESQLELSESLDKERQLNEIKSRFVSMASHEFRTPLSTILSSATLVSKYPETDDFEKREKHIRRIKDSVNHMNELLEDFLSLGKLEEGKVGVTVSSFCVKDFVEDVVDEMKAHLKNGQEIILVCSGDASFKTDKRMLKNILLNLISNAIKFSQEGKTVKVSTMVQNKELVISVKDHGLGIPDEDQPHLFSTFFRAKNVSNIQGTGLGLPIVKRYVTLLGGDIELLSELEKGTEVTISLPEYQEPSVL
ncbi:MAG TPA: PAS domain-containing sensor histidine kinase [Chitinophagaceae bacterium]|nr:PAS domain-containing sensor histidine kinase [Chitinophagaceae bacterium]HNU15275.1 PAS domain-containing sensor histidine kinase [Chitinophagaceae bacterium]